MKPIKELLNTLIKAQNMNLITISYRAEPLQPIPEIEVVFTDAVTPLARTKFLMHIEKTYNVKSWWGNIDKLYIREQA